MSDVLFVTSGDMRRQVRNGWHDSTITRMWKNGCDTLDIARAITVHESAVAHRLWQLKSVPARVSEPAEHAGRGD